MLARVVTIHVRPQKMDECISIFREVNAPSIAVGIQGPCFGGMTKKVPHELGMNASPH